MRVAYCLACWLLLATLACAGQLGQIVAPEAAALRPGESLVHEGAMLVRVGGRLIGSSDPQSGPALALVSSFARQDTGPVAALDALVFLALWHDEVEQSASVEARMREQAQRDWQQVLSARDATEAAALSAHGGRVVEYLAVRQSLRDYVQRRFSIDNWPPPPAELERRQGLEDKMRARVLTIGQRHGIDVLDPQALQQRVPGWSWSAAVERFLALGL